MYNTTSIYSDNKTNIIDFLDPPINFVIYRSEIQSNENQNIPNTVISNELKAQREKFWHSLTNSLIFFKELRLD